MNATRVLRDTNSRKTGPAHLKQSPLAALTKALKAGCNGIWGLRVGGVRGGFACFPPSLFLFSSNFQLKQLTQGFTSCAPSGGSALKMGIQLLYLTRNKPS